MLISRFDDSSARLIYDRYLVNYMGTDTSVLRAIVGVVSKRTIDEPQTWATALPIIAHAYTHDVVFPTIVHSRKHAGAGPERYELPPAEARRICADAGAYPLSLVGLAEAVLASQTGADAIPVGKIAARDDWFVPE